jgi:protein gp37
MMAEAPQHTFQVLTKRPARLASLLSRPEFVKLVDRAVCDLPDQTTARLLEDGWRGEWPLPNVWIGTSVEDQKAAELRIPKLLATPAAVRFLSCEPLLGPVDLTASLGWRGALGVLSPDPDTAQWGALRHAGLHWMIVGGESGPGARPMDLAWARSLVEQSRAAGVAPFVKQLGKCWSVQAGHGAGHGGDPEHWPTDLQVREFPA